MCLADVNDHFLHSDGDMHSYFIDKEHKSCLNTDEDNKSHLETVQDQRSMGHATVLMQTSDVGLKDTFVWLMSTIESELFLMCTDKSFPSQKAITDICY
jgi:hypothetical protein